MKGNRLLSFKQLKVWQIAHGLVLFVYRITKFFPADEKYGLSAQMRRAAVSVAANIAEGFGRKGSKDKAHFYVIARSSLSELRYYFILIQDLGYKKNMSIQEKKAEEVSRMLSGLVARMSI